MCSVPSGVSGIVTAEPPRPPHLCPLPVSQTDSSCRVFPQPRWEKPLMFLNTEQPVAVGALFVRFFSAVTSPPCRSANHSHFRRCSRLCSGAKAWVITCVRLLCVRISVYSTAATSASLPAGANPGEAENARVDSPLSPLVSVGPAFSFRH